MGKRIILISSVIFFFQLSFHVYGEEPLNTLKNSTNDVLDILKDPVYKDGAKKELQKEKLRAKIRDIFDFNEMAKRTLATYWKKLSPEQRVEFTDLFSVFLQKLYITRIQDCANTKILYLSENMPTKLNAAVKAKIVTKIFEIPIDYRMIMKNEGWKIYDVNIAGVSLLRNYRAQFQQILMKESPDALIERLKRKVRADRENEFAKGNECLKTYFSGLGLVLSSGSKAQMFTLRTDMRTVFR